MSTPKDLDRQMAEKTDDQLLAMLKEPCDWIQAALDAAKAELRKRNVDFSQVVPTDHTIRFSTAEILVVAKRQKAVLWLILLSVPAYVASVAIPIPYLPIIVAIISLVFIYQLAAALKESAPWLYVVLGLIPCISLIALLVINARATAALKACGIRVSLMGARRADLDKLETNAA